MEPATEGSDGLLRMTETTSSYLICSTPRSGTTLLCETLTATGIAGRPQEYFQHLSETCRPRTPRDYFGDVQDPEVLDLLSRCGEPPGAPNEYDPSAFESYDAYFAWALDKGTTPNGVFGAKLMWAYLPGLLSRLATPAALASGDAAQVLRLAFPSLRLLFVVREDKVRQAVSLWRALQTWTWRAEPAAPGAELDEWLTLEYSFEAIDHLVHRLAEEEQAWTEFFEEHDLAHMTVIYEQLAAAPEATALEVLRHLGLDTRGIEFGRLRMRRQADGLSDEWVRRYFDDATVRVS